MRRRGRRVNGTRYSNAGWRKRWEGVRNRQTYKVPHLSSLEKVHDGDGCDHTKEIASEGEGEVGFLEVLATPSAVSIKPKHQRNEDA